ARDRAGRGARHATVCLVGAALCELLIAGVCLVLKVRGTVELRLAEEVDFGLEYELDDLLVLAEAYATLAVFPLLLAALVRLRGATVAVRAVAVVGLVPHTAVTAYSYFLPWGEFTETRYTTWYEEVIPWPACAAGLLCLAGTVLLFTTGDTGRGGHPVAGDRG
ncbi:hypothetical protein ACFQ08_31190, partial [Streptosporangium algeriense]